MKTIARVHQKSKMKVFLAILSLGLLSLSCSDDDNPPIIDEEEVITTMTIILSEGTNSVTLQSRDLDGDGPSDPIITVSGNLLANTSYTGTISLLNETVTPAENITLEVAEEDDEHQFFFNVSGALTSTAYADVDSDGNPLGLAFILTTGDAGNGELRVTLRHEPKKPNDGTLVDAGGETDIAQSFNVVVE